MKQAFKRRQIYKIEEAKEIHQNARQEAMRAVLITRNKQQKSGREICSPKKMRAWSTK